MYFCETKEEPSKNSVSVALARIENFPSISVFAPTFDEILCTEIFSTSNESTTIIPRRTFRSMPCENSWFPKNRLRITKNSDFISVY